MKNTHISSGPSQKKMASDVYVLDEPERRILKYLALHGPLNIHQIEKYTTNYGYGLERWAIKNRLLGSSRFIGLIPYDFVFETYGEKHTFGKQEKKYHLTLKGILASCATVPIEKNYFVKQFVAEILRMTNYPKLGTLIFQYITEHVKLLIVWYYANGFQMQKNTTGGYFTQQDLEEFYHTEQVSFTHPDLHIKKAFSAILENCLKLNTILDLLSPTGLSNDLSLAGEIKFDRKFSFTGIRFPVGMVTEWPLYLGNKNKFPKNKLSSFRNKTEIQYNEFISKEFVEDIQNKIQNMNLVSS